MVDGDTFSLYGEKIRIVGIDTPEIGETNCLAEKLLGLRAKKYLEDTLYSHTELHLNRVDEDKYGRTLAHVWVDGVDIAAALIREGLAVKYTGKKCDWCEYWD